MSRVLEINDLAELSDYRLLWNSLLPQTPRASYFHTLDWLEVYWEHFGSDQKLRVLVVYGEEGPLGIMPLCVRTEHYKVGPVRILTYPLHDWGTFYGPIGPNSTATLLAGLSHIRSTPRDWDLIDLRYVDADRVDGARTPTAMRQEGFTCEKAAYKSAGVIQLDGKFDDWMSARASKWRTNYRRNERRLGDQGKVTYLRYRPLGAAHGEHDPRWDLYDQCELVAAQSWQGASTTGTTITHDSVRDYFRAAHERAAHIGMLDLNLLYVGGEPVAFAYNYQFQHEVQGIRVGFDPERGQNGAGNALYVRAIEDSYLRGDKVYDLGVGSLESKRHLVTHLETSYRYTYFPPLVWRAQALRAKRAVKNWWESRRAAAEKDQVAAAAESPATA